jgi:transposase-like protein
MNLSELSKLTEAEARVKFESIRWPNGPVCLHCGCFDSVSKLKGKAHRQGLYKCNDCGRQFSSTTGTIMEASHLPIRTWMMAFAIMCSSKKGVSALQLKRQLNIGSYRSAWHMAHRIRHAMLQEPMLGLLKGVVIADETYVGGKPRRGEKGIKGRGTKKTPVVALVERGGRARAWPITYVNARTLKRAIRENVDPSATIHTDEFSSYKGIGRHFAGGHHHVNHGKGEYFRDGVSTNDAEAFFSLLKRGVVGSFHHVSKKHLHRYCNEFSFRWNYRKDTDENRTVAAIQAADGKRLMYQDPIRKMVQGDDPSAPF